MPDTPSIVSSEPGHYGVPGLSQVSLQRVAVGTMWNLQGAPDNPSLAAQATNLWGVGMLPTPHRGVSSTTHRLLWVGPKSWLVFGLSLNIPADRAMEPAFNDCRDRINAAGGALFDVSDSRVGWTLSGPRALDVLASGCPLDLHENKFVKDQCAQSLFGHVAALYHRHSDGNFTLYVARSFSDDVWEALCSSAAQYGYQVLPVAQ